MAISGACALLIGLFLDAPAWVVLAIGLVWGFTVVADSAQFSTLVTEHADQAYVGTALTMQLALGFTLTVATIWLLPFFADAVGWRWAFAFLVPGPGARGRGDAAAQSRGLDRRRPGRQSPGRSPGGRGGDRGSSAARPPGARCRCGAGRARSAGR